MQCLGRLADRRAVPAAQVSLASGIGSMFQNIAGMFGVAIATAVFGDVKPANILVDARAGRPDHVYLSDFGVSKGAVSSVSLTGTG